MIPYFQDGEEEASQYTRNSTKKIIPVCPFCKRISKREYKICNIYTNHGFQCSCNDGISIPNKFIFSICEQLYNDKLIDHFENEYQISDTTFYYDIYFEKDHNGYFIEMDGGLGHGHKPSKSSFIKKTPEETKQRDIIKDELAKKHNINMIRIDATLSNYNYLKESVCNSDLCNIVNLDNVNFIEAYEFAMSNLVKKVCDYKNEHPEVFTQEMCKIFHLSHTCILSYLKRGTEIGWCNYNGEDEIKRYNNTYLIIQKRYRCVSVLNLKTNIIDYYHSLSTLENESKEKYGFTMWRHTVEKKIITDPYYYKGYYLKEVSNDDFIKWAKENNYKERIIL